MTQLFGPKPRQPEVADVVVYTPDGDELLPALVLGPATRNAVGTGPANLLAFDSDGEAEPHLGVPFSSTPAPNTWRWRKAEDVNILDLAPPTALAAPPHDEHVAYLIRTMKAVAGELRQYERHNALQAIVEAYSRLETASDAWGGMPGPPPMMEATLEGNRHITSSRTDEKGIRTYIVLDDPGAPSSAGWCVDTLPDMIAGGVAGHLTENDALRAALGAAVERLREAHERAGRLRLVIKNSHHMLTTARDAHRNNTAPSSFFADTVTDTIQHLAKNLVAGPEQLVALIGFTASPRDAAVVKACMSYANANHSSPAEGLFTLAEFREALWAERRDPDRVGAEVARSREHEQLFPFDHCAEMLRVDKRAEPVSEDGMGVWRAIQRAE